MTGRLQLIEQKLIAIDPAGFQNLCDTYLVLRENEYSSLNRTGSQLGKQKTILGTPDSFVRLCDNKLAYVEYTTQADSKVSKIKGDIDKCLDSSKTGVAKTLVNKIIVCFNSRLTLEEETQIQSYAESNCIILELIGIDTLALEIMSKYLLLSRDFLGIPIDTGQILPFDRFIAEYNNKASQLSTPLDNRFLHRKNELEEISNHLQTEDLLILSGAPGVGKTKIGIEAINKFIGSNPSFQSFAISKKDVDIFEDLKIQLQTDKDYILLIDDANRQLSNLSQILGVFKEIRHGKIKIVITVRNYALSDINKFCSDFKSHIINILKFTDPEIIKIIESDPFEILNSKYQQKIVAIADGNVRLAVMGARLAKERQTEFLWGDVSDLFDSYFSKFLVDFDLFENKILLKTLALISFFFTINREDKAFISSLLDLFEIDYYDFNEAIEELHRRELIEVQYNHARISEQVMATYFFYKVFIKENLLSFKKLLFNFFPVYKSRFKDSIIPANNSFGYENVISKINNTLSYYLRANSENEKKVLDFLDLFWFYKPEDTITYFYTKISTLPEPINPVYLAECKINDFDYGKEQTIDFLTRFFNNLTDWFGPAVELGFEFIRKKPEYLPEYIRRIREYLMFDESDERLGFQRQVIFTNILVIKVKQDEYHYISAFFALAKTFLAHYSDITHSGRNHTITWYKYPIPLYEVTQKIRTNIWNTLFDKYDQFPDEVYGIIRDFNTNFNDRITEIVDFDLLLVIPFIRDKFNPANFMHAYFIHDFIYWLDKESELKNQEYHQLKSLYQTEEYSNFCKFYWNILQDKNEYEFDFEDIQEYEKLKTEEIRKNFTFSSEIEFEKLHKTVSNTLSIQDDNHFIAAKSIDIVIETNFINNNDLGFKLFVSVLLNYPAGLCFLYSSVSTISSSSKEWCKKLWNIIEAWDNENNLLWKINFFNYIKDEFIDEFFCQKLLETIQGIDRYVYICIGSYSRYRKFNHNFISEILKIIVDKINRLKISIVLNDQIFEKNIDLISDDYQLLKDSYFQQFRINHSPIFDYHSRGFEKIFLQYPNFLIDFLNMFCTRRRSGNENRNIKLSFIWKYENIEDCISEASNYLIENNFYLGPGNYTHSILFKDLKTPEKEKAYKFILGEIKIYCHISHKVTIYFDTIKSCMNEKFEDTLLFYLSINSNVEDFEKVDWVGHIGIHSGDVNSGELYAKKWKIILEIVRKCNDTLAMIPIVSFLKGMIASQYRWAESEREQKFLRPDW